MKYKLIQSFLLVFCLLCFAGCHSGQEKEPGFSQSDKAEIERTCTEIALLYQDLYLNSDKAPASPSEGTPELTQAGIDAIENFLASEGYCVIDSEPPYPSHLENPQKLYAFWNQMQAGEEAQFSIIQLSQSGGFSYCVFRYQSGKGEYCGVDIKWDEANEPYTTLWEEHDIIDLELTENGRFYYQILPTDAHYSDYIMIRLTPTDKALYDLTMKYILPIGYRTVNLFLCDWTEENYGDLSFNDLFEYLYAMQTGTALDPDQFTYPEGISYYQIPASLFEGTILPYFNISLEAFREAAAYHPDGDFYPWATFYYKWGGWYPMVEPEVTACTANSDGTLTLEVTVCSPDVKLDCIFSHEVTIRPTEGGFQFVSNRITGKSEYGLPSKYPRLPEETRKK